LTPYIDKASFDLPAYGFLRAGRSDFTISTIEKAESGSTESVNNATDEGEVYLPAVMSSDILSELPCEVSYKGKSYSNYGALLVALFDEYLPAHIDELYAEGASNGYNGTKEEYAALIQMQEVNPYGKSGWELYAGLYADRGEEFGFPETLTVTFTVAGQEISFRVGGWLNEKVGKTLYVNAAAYEQLHAAWGGEYDTVIMSLSSKNAVLRIPTNSPEHGEHGENNAVYAANHYLIDGIEKAMSAVEKIRTIARIAAVTFGVFAALLFVQFIAQSVADRSQTLVVLRTLGASKSETAKIFILQALITGGAVFGAALLFGGAGCIALNKFFAAVIGTKLTVVTFGAATIFTLLFSVIALSVIGALVPVLHATHTDKLIMNE
jgi:hypothetical protein